MLTISKQRVADSNVAFENGTEPKHSLLLSCAGPFFTIPVFWLPSISCSRERIAILLCSFLLSFSLDYYFERARPQDALLGLLRTALLASYT